MVYDGDSSKEVAGRVTVPRDVHILIPYYATWQGGIEAANGIEVADQLTSRWEGYPALYSVQRHHQGPYK